MAIDSGSIDTPSSWFRWYNTHLEFRLLAPHQLRVTVPSDLSYKAWIWEGLHMLLDSHHTEHTSSQFPYTDLFLFLFLLFFWSGHVLTGMGILAIILVVLSFSVLLFNAMRARGGSDILHCSHLCYFSDSILSAHWSQGLSFLGTLCLITIANNCWASTAVNTMVGVTHTACLPTTISKKEISCPFYRCGNWLQRPWGLPKTAQLVSERTQLHSDCFLELITPFHSASRV